MSFLNSMVFELLILVALIVIFIASFCGLLQKIRQTYENERRRLDAENRDDTFTEIYINPNFIPDEVNNNSGNSDGVFPSTPPPYSDLYGEPPPKYEDIFKELDIQPHQLPQQN